MILDEHASVVLDAAGGGAVTLAPATPRQRWHVTNVAVSGSDTSGADDPQCRVYYGVAAPQNLLAATYSGNGDNAEVGVTLYPGSVLTVVWAGGVPGAVQTASLVGTYDVAGA